MLLTENGLQLAAFDASLASLVGNNPQEAGFNLLIEAGRHQHRRVELWDWFYLLLKSPMKTVARTEFIDKMGMKVEPFINGVEAAFDLGQEFEGSPPPELLPTTVSPSVLQMLDRAETLAREYQCPNVSELEVTLAVIETAGADMTDFLAEVMDREKDGLGVFKKQLLRQVHSRGCPARCAPSFSNTSPSHDMDPPRRDFENLWATCHRLLAENSDDSALKAYESQLDTIEAAAKDASGTRDHRAWINAYGALLKLHASMEMQLSTPSCAAAPSIPPPHVLKAHAFRIIEELRASLKVARESRMREHGGERCMMHLDECERRIDHMASQVDRIPDETPKEQALAQLQNYLTPMESLRKKIIHIHTGTAVDHAAHSVPQRREGTPEMPSWKVDRIHFSVTSPPSVVPGSSFVIDVWAHLDRQRQQVLERAREEAMGANVQIKSKGPVKVARGTILTVSLRVADLTVDPPEDTILWEGEIGNTTFALTVPKSATEGTNHGVARIRVEGFEVARLNFIIEVGPQRASLEALPMQEQRHQTAFASYASEDSNAVLGRIQGMQKVMPSLKVFYAAAELRSGEHWQQRLKQEILGRDVMYLFWSEAASRSQWVEWEWRCGYRERGIDFIDPCPLVSPDSVSPPTELADHLHFNDWVLAYMRSPVKTNDPN